MKKYSLLLLSFLLNACSQSILDVNPTDRFTDQTFWQTEEHAVAGLNAIYNSLFGGSLHGGQIMGELEAATPNAYAYQSATGNIARGIHDASNTPIINTRWNQAYAGIGRANTLLERIPAIQMSETNKKRYIGEAKFLRALYYFDLWSVYGGVPVIVSAPDAEQGTLPRNSADEVLAQILKDLDEAAADLPKTYSGNDRGRATSGAALALKARTLLYASRWAEAAAAAKSVMDAKTYTLFPDFRGLFMQENEGNTEVIFDVQYKNPEYVHGNDINYDQFNGFAPVLDLVNDFYMIDGKPITSSPLYNPAKPYENRDPRLNATIMTVGSMFKGRPVIATTYPQTGFGLKKGTTYKDNEAPPAGKVDNISDLNNIVLRYGEVLLNYAEAQNEATGPDASVYEALNLLRARAGMPAFPAGLSKDQMRQEIRHERRIETAGEGLYYFDIRRWRIAEVVMNSEAKNWLGNRVDTRTFDPARDYLWPIPTTATQLNQNLTQNPGYNQ
ncbi:RagB/SusD family nutrient uptake outer membrane protein [Arundinibacter roseus]|uniref:RagB/SusD family nutrient uptake outer membrane protein n=1 Tax=Arundinibacter roseus TaxID=2070510 RepID=A0A4R4KIC1_9BACT|nr:RagB/SusD family nutrient uptake outer membrane protein [Arundinibacter roseus]TDB67907.1 RagB/SusD family nutrient uptake outer membrane protein [Arundinibacter roseus]